MISDWECKQCCADKHCGKCSCCKNAKLELAKKRSTLVTVLVENIMLNKTTGFPEKQGWIYHSAPTTLGFAKAYAADLRRCNKSYRIVTKDNKEGSVIIDEWLRQGFIPDK